MNDKESPTFQTKVKLWTDKAITPEAIADKEIRCQQMLEEAVELAQACGYTQSQARQVIDYVFSRKVGVKQREVGDLQIALAALCTTFEIDMKSEAEVSLYEVWENIEAIKARQPLKPKFKNLAISMHS
jgi:NTP pyrophosphatase (non-canonical NTP hydrolase)